MRALFVGTRCAVLDAAADLGLDIVKVLTPLDSPLYKRSGQANELVRAMHDKEQLFDEIASTSFDLLISNGCPYILPVSKLKASDQLFVNIHPSLLPNLRGRHPVNGAVLYAQPLGASCHLMDDGIDTGTVIARVHVDVNEPVELGLLYRLAFMAEAEAFRKAYHRNFIPGSDELNHLSMGNLYFSRTPNSLSIDFGEPIDLTLRRVAAFSVPGQMARFEHKGNIYLVPRACRVESNFLASQLLSAKLGSIVMKYDDSIVVKLADGCLLLSGIIGNHALLHEGSVLIEPSPADVRDSFSELV